MRHKEFDSILETRSDFEVTLATNTWLNNNDKLLFGPTSARDIARIIPTEATYVWSGGLFRADYAPVNVLMTGIGALDELREVPSQVPFKLYGFDYCPAEEDYAFRASNPVSSELEPEIIEFDMNRKEFAMLARYTLTKAMIDLATSDIKQFVK